MASLDFFSQKIAQLGGQEGENGSKRPPCLFPLRVFYSAGLPAINWQGLCIVKDQISDPTLFYRHKKTAVLSGADFRLDEVLTPLARTLAVDSDEVNQFFR